VVPKGATPTGIEDGDLTVNDGTVRAPARTEDTGAVGGLLPRERHGFGMPNPYNLCSQMPSSYNAKPLPWPTFKAYAVSQPQQRMI